MDIWQAIIRTSRSCAASISSGRLAIFFWAMICFIIPAPMPPMFNCDRGRLAALFGSIHPSIFCIQLRLQVAEGPPFLSAERPQKVKNIVVFIPMAAAVVAMMNAPITLSMEPENTTMVAFFSAEASDISTRLL